MHRTTLHSNPRFNPFIAAALSKPVETVSPPLLSSVESSPVSIPPLKVSSNSLQYPPGYLGAVPDRSYSDDGNVVVSPMSYLTNILTSKVYDVAKETPLELAPKLSERLGVNIWLKREDLQPVRIINFSLLFIIFFLYFSFDYLALGYAVYEIVDCVVIVNFVVGIFI
jgi:threonine dehydratase